MAAVASEKTFHLKWNNHLQNLSQLFTTIYSSASLADVTLACRDGTIKAHKLVLSACSPYFEQLFKDNPCKHPIVILKGIPYQEINLLVEFMYKGSVDVQELDLQSLMHTASELEIRGLAYELRTSASQLLNVNLECPAEASTSRKPESILKPQNATDMQRLKEIHEYQQQQIMMSQNEYVTKRRKLNNEYKRGSMENQHSDGMGHSHMMEKVTTSMQLDGSIDDVNRPKKRVSFGSVETENGGAPVSLAAEGSSGTPSPPAANSAKSGGIKVVNISQLQNPLSQHQHADRRSDSEGEQESNLLQEQSSRMVNLDDYGLSDEDSSESDDNDHNYDSGNKIHKCDVCEARFSRLNHLERHQLKHTGERPYACGGCGRSFSRSDKLRLHLKICEKNDPTVSIKSPPYTPPSSCTTRDSSPPVRTGSVRPSHPDSSNLIFTQDGHVVLHPNAVASQVKQEQNTSTETSTPFSGKRGRGRPRKLPLPTVPKIKKRRGRPPKEPCRSANGYEHFLAIAPKTVDANSDPSMFSAGYGSSNLATSMHNMAMSGLPTMVPHHYGLEMKKRRGRKPKDYLGHELPGKKLIGTISYVDSESQQDPIKIQVVKSTAGEENYNATNLPFGDFNFLMYNSPYGINPFHQLANSSLNELRESDHSRIDEISTTSTRVGNMDSMDYDMKTEMQKSINLSSPSTEDDNMEQQPANQPANDSANHYQPRIEPANEPPTRITVGDCEIVKLPNNTDAVRLERGNEKAVNEMAASELSIIPVNESAPAAPTGET